MSAGPPGPVRSSGAMNVIAALLESRTGQQIDANRAWRIETALKPVLRARGLGSLDELVKRILDGRAPELAEEVVDALLNQESSFFRDTQVIEMVAEAATRIGRDNPGRRVRIWSAGCSMGQEPLSLAMLFNEHAERDALPMPDIIATDVSEAALARAREGRYSQFEIQRGLPVRRMMLWFDSDGGDWIARPELVRQIQFRRQNLVGDPPPIGRFDIVLCRNVLFYLAAGLRRQIFDTFAQVIRPGGLLVLGAGETVIGQTDAFQPSTAFRGLYEATGRTVVPAPLAKAG
ncbi:MAG TPA: protein-glutamate O-methyltransferase CheR [Sphingomonas sp.]|nr:protein-glutamate O-methyltransferase CheR [Sphingomonas sp.]